MTRYEYQVIPAPRKGKKARGVKGTEARFAFAMQETLNDAAAEGWEYVRTDTLPSEERSGLTGRTTIYQNLLVFRRALETHTEDADVAAPDVTPVTALTGLHTSEPQAPEENFAPSLPSATDANDASDTAPSIAHDDR